MKLVQPQTVSIECMYWAFFARETKIQHRYARILVIHASPHTLLLKKISKNSGLPGSLSMDAPCIGALVCASTYGLHMVIIFGMWGEAPAWICTVS